MNQPSPLCDWGREVLGILPVAEAREWLVTNGLGGFASGTVAGLLTRRYHGLLVAPLQPPLGRTLLVAKLEETLERDGETRSLGVNRWADGTLAPEGHRDLERFRLDGTTPVWTYVEALRQYHAATEDDGLLKDLFPVLEEIVRWHRQGTRYGIAEDPDDGLLRAGAPGVQLTWMDARIGDWVVTPRTGKAVEINALWYNALRTLGAFARRLGRAADAWDAAAERVRVGFGRFWHEAGGYCYDVIDGSDGADASLRPNQILAVALAESPLSEARQRRVVAACARHLLASYGLRSLAPGDARYQGRYGGGPRERDAGYHQGPVWGWLLGPFALAHLRVHGDPAAARAFLEPMAHHLADHGVGSLAELFDGDPPFTPRGCIAQAWSVAETLRAWLAVAVAESVAAEPTGRREFASA